MTVNMYKPENQNLLGFSFDFRFYFLQIITEREGMWGFGKYDLPSNILCGSFVFRSMAGVN
jgi:hypothetical protein